MLSEKLFLLIAGHALADFGLQSDWMAKNKNRNHKSDYIPAGQTYTATWFYVLGAHAFMHGLMVYLITGQLFFGVIETIMHFCLDFLKCDNYTNPHQDQIAHLLLKVIYVWKISW